ncbi:hypothetical protein Thi970DRAFT_03433 [Thiorhodovibrio frisius]|uniref:Uncharacterized protein n=1 Tax=Thiorhodovibrio frisius TaxID=631362 RepID=H8Z7B3_9GAMM|nr:hypothetical protein Thi970DRAFT_03433 [Thiorhodovibrio frisius]WPL20557.1 hypothetical protein Thiofri_00656 [Thiorhodovibrio frisius]
MTNNHECVVINWIDICNYLLAFYRFQRWTKDRFNYG